MACIATAATCLGIVPCFALPACPPRNDFNADGRSDVLWRNTNGSDFIFLMSGISVLGGSNYTNSVPDPGWQVVGTGDFDGDGNADILWRKASSGENYIFLMNVTAVKAGSNYINSVGAPWTVAGNGDFDGDGKADILWRNTSTGEDYIFFMNGTSVKGSSNYTNAVPDQHWRVAGTGDFDGDGKSDILWRYDTTGQNYIFLMNGTAVQGTSGYTNTVPTQWAVAGIGDFDGDGRSDILWRNNTMGEDFIFLMNGTTELANSGYTNGVAAPWTIVGTGDHDGDGKADILWRNPDTGEDYVFLMSGLTVLGGSGYTNAVPDSAWSIVPSPVLTGSSACGSVTPSFAASRTSGVAPLAVFFDATATTATATTNPFQDVEYRWAFGDPLGSPDPASGTTWKTGAQAGVSSRNAAFGPVAAHVFERPGTYTVTLSAYDGARTGTSTVQIIVSDPDADFSGQKTVCFSNSTNFSGCPAGALTVSNSSDFSAAVSAYAQANRRLLFQRGGTWSNGANLSAAGPGIIGAYGSGPKPIISDPGEQLRFSTVTDWRVMDLNMDGQNSTNAEGFHAEHTTTQVTILRCDVHDERWAFNFAPDILNYYGNSLHDQLAIVDSTGIHGVGGAGSNLAYIGAKQFMFLGNDLHDATQIEHVLRLPYVNRFVIADSTLADPASTKHVLKLHAQVYSNTSPPSAFSEIGVISGNKMSSSGSGVNWIASIEPQNAESNENIRKLVIERNWIVGSPAGGMAALHLSIADSVVRNNVIDTSASTDATGIFVGQRGVENAPSGDRIYNNTVYSSAGGAFSGIRLDSSVSSTIVRNNLGYAPTAGGSMVSDGGSGDTKDHNTGNAGLGSLTTSPSFTSTGPFNPANAKIKAGSYAIGGGTSVPAWSDFFGVTRAAAPDLGAVAH
ncbi:MAG TPA: FG-GAP-like repeat-containing protein [Rhodothermales bacterium]